MGLYDQLCHEYGHDRIFAAFADASTYNTYDSPIESAYKDVSAIQECDLFILIYPQKVASSALMELGIAFAEKKQIIIVSSHLEILPYMIQGLPFAYPDQVHWVETSTANNLMDEVMQIEKKMKD